MLVQQASQCLTELHHGAGLNPLESGMDIDSEYGVGGQGAFTFLNLEKTPKGEAGFTHFNPHQLPAAAFCAIPGGLPQARKPVLIDVIMARPADEKDHLLSVVANHPRIVWVSPTGKVDLLGPKEKVPASEVLRATCRPSPQSSLMVVLKRQLVRILKTVGQRARKVLRQEGAPLDGVNLALTQLRGALRTCASIPDAGVQKAIAQAKTDLELNQVSGKNTASQSPNLTAPNPASPETSAVEAGD